WYYYNNTLGGAMTVTATLGGSQTSCLLSLYEFSGCALEIDAASVTKNVTTATTAPTSGNLTTVNAYDLLLVAYRGGTISASPSGWVAQNDAANRETDYKLVTS